MDIREISESCENWKSSEKTQKNFGKLYEKRIGKFTIQFNSIR